ncbi:phosphate acetyltransferase [Peptoniphilus gorbachii]|uniref:Phosphate acetyltransferase n=1 Tax=Peptoniphilus gorbachii TaxID=411567 RepID=A0ABS2MKE1_9FIRM|nr:phosphate acetyltransferase [Peptoniphilus gorbachii]MDU1022443.1 phosphate acetyltransferase [Peptoniphilus harei]MBM7550485.1 phosphate acetyltransferase [Peptoniphilus gorbachii]MDU3009530.1 phosphate acetyltransferase [Peptoniphilus harei]MDU5570862.1 phosphate acetyltransferase [Peptoniphilus harei]MDU6783980.1 phosphate acetyltransferase [Peptoniphilus harei]
MSLIENLRSKVRASKPEIVFPEGDDARILRAAIRLNEDGDIKPIVLGDKKELEALAEKEGVKLGDLEILDPANYEAKDEMVKAFVERRKGKATEAQAAEILKDHNYFGTMLIYMGKAKGLVSGAAHTTADTVRPALQIIKTKEGYKRCSGAFIMLRGEEMYLMADCAINIDLDAEGLAEVAVVSNETARQFGMDPKIAMLSFSTKGSASHERVTMVAEATKMAKEKNPDMAIDGELQFDAAFVESVAKKKAPGSEVAGHANVFVFPNIEAGNIGYKIAQRFGGFEAIGPILQGLNAPVNDLSRGCVEDEVYSLAIITAAQAVL